MGEVYHQLRLLCWKTWLQKRRQIKATLFEVLIPLVIVYLIAYIYAMNGKPKQQTIPQALNVNRAVVVPTVHFLPLILYQAHMRLGWAASDPDDARKLLADLDSLYPGSRQLNVPKFSDVVHVFPNSEAMDKYCSQPWYGDENNPQLFGGIILRNVKEQGWKVTIRMNASTDGEISLPAGMESMVQLLQDEKLQQDQQLFQTIPFNGFPLKVPGFVPLQNMVQQVIQLQALNPMDTPDFLSSTSNSSSLNAYDMCLDIESWKEQLQYLNGFVPPARCGAWLSKEKQADFERFYRSQLVFPSLRNVQVQPFPAKERTTLQDPLENSVTAYLIYIWAFPLSRFVRGIVLEKETKNREMMLTMGLQLTVLYASWFITYGVISTIICLYITFKFDQTLFFASNMTLIFFLFMVFAMSCFAFGFLISTFFDRSKSATTATPLLLLVLCLPSIPFRMGSKVDTTAMRILKMLAPFSSPTVFSRTVHSIFELDHRGESFGWKQMTHPAGDDGFSYFDGMFWMTVDIALYFALAWYFDHILPKEFGMRYPWNFIFKSSFWCPSSKPSREPFTSFPLFGKPKKEDVLEQTSLLHASSMESSTLISGEGDSEVEDDLDVQELTLQVSDDDDDDAVNATQPAWEEDPHPSLNANANANSSLFEEVPLELRQLEKSHRCIHLRGLSKTFDTGKVAVSDLNLTMYEGEIFGLLGSNGAGKTTTISMISGMLPPTTGQALVYGRDIAHDMNSIRKYLGVCFQHDVLYENLTVLEHLQFFAALKRPNMLLLSKKEKESKKKNKTHGQAKNRATNTKSTTNANAQDVDLDEAAEIDDLLAQVGLTEKRHAFAVHLSGGQKRKLSLALAFVGRSKVVFLDEPTSGMDPYSRRFTWNLLRKNQANRIMILTTHLMDEADILCHRIGIMAQGRLQCCGTPLFLKQKFGVGYNLTVVRKPKSMMKKNGEGWKKDFLRQSLDHEDDSKGGDEVQGYKHVDEHEDEHIHEDEDEDEDEQGARLIKLVKSHVCDAIVLSNVGLELTLQLPNTSSSCFPALFHQLEDLKESMGVASYGISATTVEEVFLKVAQNRYMREGPNAGFSSSTQETREQVKLATNETTIEMKKMDDSLGCFNKDKQVGDKILGHLGSVESEMNELEPPSTWVQLHALLIKRMKCTIRDKKMLFSQFVFPLFFLGFILHSFAELTHGTRDHLVATDAWMENQSFEQHVIVPYSVRFNATENSSPEVLSKMDKWMNVLASYQAKDGNGAQLRNEGFARYIQLVPPTLKKNMEKVESNEDEDDSSSNQAFSTRFAQYLLSSMDSLSKNERRSIAMQINAFDVSRTSLRLVYNNSMENSLLLGWKYMHAAFCHLATTTTLPTKSKSKKGLHRGLKDLDFNGSKVDDVNVNTLGTTHVNGQEDNNNATTHSMSSRMLFLPLGHVVEDVCSIELHAHPLPNTFMVSRVMTSMVGFMTALSLLMTFSNLTSSFASFVIQEKTQSNKFLQIISGTSIPLYWASHFLWDFILYVLFIVVILAMLVGFGIEALVGKTESFLAVLLLLLTYGLASIPMMYLCSLLFTSHSSAQTYLSYLNLSQVVLLTISYVLSVIPTLCHTLTPYEWMFEIFPGYSFGIGLLRLTTIDMTGWRLQCQKKNLLEGFTFDGLLSQTFAPLDHQVTGHLLEVLCASALFYSLLTVGMDTLLNMPRFLALFQWEESVLQRVLTRCIKKRVHKVDTNSNLRSSRTPTTLEGEDDEDNQDDLDDQDEQVEHESFDEDVEAERQRVISGQNVHAHAIELNGLRKVYTQWGLGLGFGLGFCKSKSEQTMKKTQKVAVKELTFGLNMGECFGFLGINGAGKSTTLKMLTGLVPPTSGHALLMGLDISLQQKQARQRIGYCPQENALFERLTVREHFELYGRIKGWRGQATTLTLHEAVDRTVRQMDLNEFEHVEASRLSGGNKRKLCVGIALMGKPSVVFLDEPSTGVDPVSRRFLWNVIQRVSTETKQCAVVLTTHCMEEAQALASVAGIMVDGELKCWGPIQHLQHRFGSGLYTEFKLRKPTSLEWNAMVAQLGTFIPSNGNGRIQKEDLIQGMKTLSRRATTTTTTTGSSMDDPKVDEDRKDHVKVDEDEKVDPKDDAEVTSSSSSSPTAFTTIKPFTFITEHVDYARDIHADGDGWMIHASLEEQGYVDVHEMVEWCCVKAQTARLRAFLEKEFTHVKFLEQHGSYVRYEMQRTHLPLGELFEAMEKNKVSLGVEEYSVSQPTLEQIFNRFASKQESDTSHPSHIVF